MRVDVSKFGSDTIVLSHENSVLSDEHHLLIGSTITCITRTNQLGNLKIMKSKTDNNPTTYLQENNKYRYSACLCNQRPGFRV